MVRTGGGITLEMARAEVRRQHEARNERLRPGRERRARKKAEADYNAAEVAKLVAFFNEPGAYSSFGWAGDTEGRTPAETAIRAMRELMERP